MDQKDFETFKNVGITWLKTKSCSMLTRHSADSPDVAQRNESFSKQQGATDPTNTEL